MGRNLPFFPTCGSPSKTIAFREPASTTGDLDDMTEIESSVDSVIRGLSSDRFFFKPGKTSSILEEAKEKEKQSVSPFKESVSMIEMESTDPYVDFKKSMQEMVEADKGLKEWDNLQEFLSLYLAVNDKINHGYIIGAFVDLMLVNRGSSASSSSSCLCCSFSLKDGQDESLLAESESSINNNKKKKKKKMVCSESLDSALSFSSSSALASTSSSSTSHCLSSCSLEEEEEEEDEDHNSPQKGAISDDDSSLKV